MAAYADWDFYETEYLGNSIAQSDFNRLALRASEEVDAMTYGRAKTAADDTLEAVKKAVCAAAETLYSMGDVAVGVHSERVGGHDITYSSTQEYSSKRQALLYEAVEKYLGWTGLLYRGLCHVD